MNTQEYILVTYVRKSSEDSDKQIASIPDQKIAIKRVKEARKLNIVETISEERSALKPGRPSFNQMLDKIEQGEIDGIACWHIDRLSRNPKDSGNLLQLLQDGVLKIIITPQRDYLPDDDALPIALEQAMANQYSRNISRNVKRGNASRADKGIFISGRKPGYMYDPIAERGSKTLIEDPDRFDLIKAGFERVASGKHTAPKVLDWLNDKCGYRTPETKKLGGKPLARSTWYKMLNDPFYYGEFEYPKGSGDFKAGIHPRMISKELYDRIQILLGKKDKPRPIKHDFAFAGGLMKCGSCGASVIGENKWQCICTNCKYKFSCKNTQHCPRCNTDIENMENPTIFHKIYFRCSKRKKPQCPERSVEQVPFEAQVDDFLSRIEISERFKNWLIKKLNEDNQSEVATRNQRYTSVKKALSHCISRLDRLLEIYISPRNAECLILSEAEFLKEKEMLTNERIGLEKELEKLGSQVDEWSELAESAFNFARHARYWFAEGDNKEKRAIVEALGLNLVLKDQKLHIQDPSLFLQLKEAREKVPSIGPMLEPIKTDKYSHEIANLEKNWDKSPTLLAWQDAFRTFDWKAAFPYPAVALKQMQDLLGLLA